MLKELFQKNPNIIINTDIDGFLCGAILQEYYGCNIVGFSNSKKEIWVTEDVGSIYEPIYIDLYVVHRDVTCIEQHITVKDEKHLKAIKDLKTKINPNIERNKTFTGDYYHKYPFGTVHYIMTLMAKEGIDVRLPELSEKITSRFSGIQDTLGNILLRADDALFSTLSTYSENAWDWWKYLDGGNNFPVLDQITRFIKSCDTDKASKYKEHTGIFFKKGYKCDGADGAFNYITNADGTLQERVSAFWNEICSSFGFNVKPLPDRLILHEGKFIKEQYSPDLSKYKDSIFSYAFIYGPNSKYPNFSFTVDMN